MEINTLCRTDCQKNAEVTKNNSKTWWGRELLTTPCIMEFETIHAEGLGPTLPLHPLREEFLKAYRLEVKNKSTQIDIKRVKFKSKS